MTLSVLGGDVGSLGDCVAPDRHRLQEAGLSPTRHSSRLHTFLRGIREVGLYIAGDTPQRPLRGAREGEAPPQSPIARLFGDIMEGHNPLAGSEPETPVGLTPSTKAACSEVLGWNNAGARGKRGYVLPQ